MLHRRSFPFSRLWKVYKYVILLFISCGSHFLFIILSHVLCCLWSSLHLVILVSCPVNSVEADLSLFLSLKFNYQSHRCCQVLFDSQLILRLFFSIRSSLGFFAEFTILISFNSLQVSMNGFEKNVKSCSPDILLQSSHILFSYTRSGRRVSLENACTWNSNALYVILPI